jgi:hypothetical protein
MKVDAYKGTNSSHCPVLVFVDEMGWILDMDMDNRALETFSLH